MSTVDARANTPDDGAERRHVPDGPACPVCSGRMWDNRSSRRNPRAPEFRCRDRACSGRIWHYTEPDDEPPSGPPHPPHRRGGPPEPIGPVVARVVASIGGAPTPGPARPNVADGTALDACPTTADPPTARPREGDPASAATRALYRETVRYVALRIAPLCSSLGVTVSGEMFAAMAATLFIATHAEHRAAQSGPVQRHRSVRHG